MFGSNGLQAQDAAPKNTFFVELGGNGLLFSVNYDYRVGEKLGFRGGLGYFGIGSEGILTVPLGANLLLGKNGKYFEAGAGATFVSGTGEFLDNDLSSLIGTLNFSYRSQPLDGGFMWKAGITPLFSNGNFIPYYIGAGIGYCW